MENGYFPQDGSVGAFFLNFRELREIVLKNPGED